MPTEKQTRYILLLLSECDYPTRFMDRSFKKLGATMRERSGRVEDWIKNLNIAEASNVIKQLQNEISTKK